MLPLPSAPIPLGPTSVFGSFHCHNMLTYVVPSYDKYLSVTINKHQQGKLVMKNFGAK